MEILYNVDVIFWIVISMFTWVYAIVAVAVLSCLNQK